MLAANLYADLISRGVALGISDDGRSLTFKAAKGILTDTLRRAMQRHRDELLEFVLNIEERAAMLSEIENPTPAQLAETRQRALQLVRFGTATPDGQLYLRDLVEHDSTFQSLNRMHAERFGCPVEIVSIERRAA
jgi:hypothetical protein